MGVHIRSGVEEDLNSIVQTLTLAFGYLPDAERIEAEGMVIDPLRSFVAVDSTVVGAISGRGLEVSLAGRSIPLTWVMGLGVLPTHQRQGIGAELVRSHLVAQHQRKEPITCLWASSASWYGAMGFGLAALSCDIDLDVRAARLSAPRREQKISPAGGDSAVEDLAKVYNEARAKRSGFPSRDQAWWRHRMNPHSSKSGRSRGPLLVAVAESNRQIDGYALYRMSVTWSRGIPAGTLEVEELLASSPESYAELWRMCVEASLVTRVQALNRPIDDPLFWMIDEPRVMQFTVRDGVWLRVVDVADALAARSYAHEFSVVIGIDDPFCLWNEGSYSVEFKHDGARARKTAEQPDVELGIAELGAVYLGGVSFLTLARAGRVRAEPEIIQALDAAFATTSPPWCPQTF